MLHKKVELLMGLVQDMAPVVKTLPEAHEASLLYDDNGNVTADDASDRSEHEVDEPLRKRSKSDFGTHHSILEAEQSTADPSGRVDLLLPK